MLRREEELRRLYQKRARHYDFTANLYYLIGFREWAYRRRAVEALALHKGATVVEIGCGTGLNFPLLEDAVGPEGTIVGIDLTPAMLDQARARVYKRGWTNVQLVQSDAAAYQFPPGIDGIVSTFALTLVPEYKQVIQHGAEALQAGKRFVILDLKAPEKWPPWLVNLGVLLTRPFGVTQDLIQRRPWEVMSQYLEHVSVTEVYFGAAYITMGAAK
jgi:ubiquinone/menaquinone biosynthesis C-methylase UbiE